jgi:chromosome partitioning protein
VVIAIFNSKGGVGKTTVAINLAAALCGPRRRVLLVDLDSQSSASVGLGVSRNQLRPSAASVLLEKYPILKAIRHTATPQLDLLTGSLELANADVVLCGMRGRETALARMLERVRDHYDVIVLDCPPGFSLLSINALVAADVILVPVSPDPIAVEALESLLAAVQRVRTRMMSRGRLAGVVLCSVDPQRKPSRDMSERVRSAHRDRLFHTELRWTAAVCDAAAARKTILGAAPKSAAADAIRRLAAELLDRLPSLRH